MDRVVALRPIWERIWAHRRPISTLVASATLAVGLVALLTPPWYLAEAVVLPPQDEDVNLSFSFLSSMGLMGGVKVPAHMTASDVLLKVLESRSINQEIAERFDLKTAYRKKLMVDTVQELRRHAKFKLNQSGSIQITVEDRDRRRAAEMANAYVELLDRFNRQVRMSKGRQTRIFIGKRVDETKHELALAEERLAAYQAKHRAVALSPQMSSAIDAAARLLAERAALQVRLGVVRNYSQGSEEEIQLAQRLSQLNRQVSGIPATGLDLVRLMRDFKVREYILAYLTTQYEEARIREARDTQVVEFLDVAVPAERRWRPQPVTMILSAFFLSLVLAIGLAALGVGLRVRPLRSATAG